MLLRASILALPCLLLGIPPALAAEQDLSQARDALTKQDNDADTERALEEVFQAAEKNYYLLRRGDTSPTIILITPIMAISVSICVFKIVYTAKAILQVHQLLLTQT